MMPYVDGVEAEGVLYSDAVTVYNAYKNGNFTHYHRTVIPGVSWSDTKNRNVNIVGQSMSQSLLLIIPQNAGGKKYIDPLLFAPANGAYTMVAGDKVVLGVCDFEVIGNDEKTLATAWNWLSTKNYDHVVTVKNIDVKRMHGVVHHLEVGG